MRKVIPKYSIINGEGKGYPYTVVADLAEAISYYVRSIKQVETNMAFV